MSEHNNLEKDVQTYAELSLRIKELTEEKKEISERLIYSLEEQECKKVMFACGSVSLVEQREKKVLDLTQFSAEDLQIYNTFLEKYHKIQVTSKSIRVSVK